MTSLRYGFRRGSPDILQVTKDALYALRILPQLIPDALAAKLSLEPAQEANSEFRLQ